jgi:hypothetical protein
MSHACARSSCPVISQGMQIRMLRRSGRAPSTPPLQGDPLLSLTARLLMHARPELHACLGLWQQEAVMDF